MSTVNKEYLEDERLNTFRRHWMCPSCHKNNERGEMFHTGITLTVQPPLFIHKCNFCNHELSTEDGIYPMVVYISDSEVRVHNEPNEF